MSKKGENMNFTMFYPDQTICNNINDFVKCYNQLYFYDTNTSVAAEKLSDNLINQTKFEKEDVFNILAWKLLTDNRSLLDGIAEALSEKRYLTGDEIRQIKNRIHTIKEAS